MNFGELFFSIYSISENFRWILGFLVFTLVPVWVLFHPGRSLESQAFALAYTKGQLSGWKGSEQGMKKTLTDALIADNRTSTSNYSGSSV
jgi:hypothetical protein